MRLEEIRLLPECPEWLKASNIVVENEVIVIYKNTVMWYEGTWKEGTWENGFWKSGTWENGIWQDGVFYNGLWKNGIWESGIWYDGTWENGTWLSGKWRSGYWEGGIKKEILVRFVSRLTKEIYYNSTHIIIGKRKKSIEKWIEFLDSGKRFSDIIDADYQKIKKIILTIKELSTLEKEV